MTDSEAEVRTPFETRVDILADLWTNKENKVISSLLSDTFEYADLSFPLAFALNEGIATGTEREQRH